MALEPELSKPTSVPDTRLGIVVRVVFFTASVFVVLRLMTSFLYWQFGAVIAATVGTCASGLIANLLTMQIFDRRPFTDVGLRLVPSSGMNFALGLLVGGGTAALMLLAPLVAGTGHLVGGGDAPPWSSLIFYLVTLGFAAAGEELMFRGYAFQLLVEKIGPFATVLPVAVVFGLAHAFNPHPSNLGLFNTILWGVVLGFAFLRSHDLWLPIGLHWGWNLVLPLFGVNLSGLTIRITRYDYRWDLLPLWSGGDYGPEGGLLATIFVSGLFFALLKVPIRTQRAAVAHSLNEPV